MAGTKKSYIEALKRDLKFQLERFNIKKRDIETIFIGGGTPSTISSNQYRDIFNIVTPLLKENSEITIEANPNSASKDWLKGVFELGVNRVSFGVQSFNNRKLKTLNRSHSPKEAILAIEDAFKVGFKNISIDLIYGLRGDTEELLREDLNIAFNLPINHISTYELTIEQNTKFFQTPNIKREDETLGYFIKDEIVNRGFEWYEVSNYGKYKSTHNLGYWQLKEYMGVGAGAVGFLKNRRLYTHTNILKYIEEPTWREVEELTEENILIEKIFLGLRSKIGIKREILTLNMQRRANILVEENRLELRDNIYRNSNFFLSDELALFLIG